jgi:hypothetical protein
MHVMDGQGARFLGRYAYACRRNPQGTYGGLIRDLWIAGFVKYLIHL